MPPLRILVVDDNEDAREMLSFFLSSRGYAVVTAVDGPTSLVAAREFKPDVAIIDIGLPGMSGHDVARALRETHDAAALALVLIALTGLSQAEDKARAAASGFNHYLIKPVDITTLAAVLVSVRLAHAHASDS